MCARSMLSCEKRLVSLFISQSSKTFESNFLCPVTMQSDPNVSSIPSLFLKAILHWMMSKFPRTLVYRSQTARKTLSRDFQDMSLLFTWFSSSKSSFFLAFHFWNLPTRSKISGEVVYTERSAHFWYEISDWYDLDIFLSGYLRDRHPIHIRLV